ncbi:hypothetical protein [Novipirellula caenicola]
MKGKKMGLGQAVLQYGYFPAHRLSGAWWTWRKQESSEPLR